MPLLSATPRYRVWECQEESTFLEQSFELAQFTAVAAMSREVACLHSGSIRLTCYTFAILISVPATVLGINKGPGRQRTWLVVNPTY